MVTRCQTCSHHTAGKGGCFLIQLPEAVLVHYRKKYVMALVTWFSLLTVFWDLTFLGTFSFPKMCGSESHVHLSIRTGIIMSAL